MRNTENKSGDYNITSKISKKGNPLIRYALHLSTIPAIRFNPVIKRYYTRNKNDGMRGNKLLIACSNKLLNIIYSVLKNNKDFESIFIIPVNPGYSKSKSLINWFFAIVVFCLFLYMCIRIP